MYPFEFVDEIKPHHVGLTGWIELTIRGFDGERNIDYARVRIDGDDLLSVIDIDGSVRYELTHADYTILLDPINN